MANGKTVLPLIAGVGIGALVGYVVRGTVFILQDYEAIRPRVDLTNASTGVPITPTTPINMFQQYRATFVNFPANTDLMAIQIQSSTGLPPVIVKVGTTDGNGQFSIVASPVSVGTYYVHAWDAPTGKYVAVASLFVVSP